MGKPSEGYTVPVYNVTHFCNKLQLKLQLAILIHVTKLQLNFTLLINKVQLIDENQSLPSQTKSNLLF